ncbi:hypothetical protein FJY70_02445 [candidate division WOR-3 bacterium]|nr:hypothetical protein [candidate division WOR-3 bacterium]
MMRKRHDACGQWPQARHRFVCAVFALTCVTVPAAAWSWDVAPARITAPMGTVDSGTEVIPTAVIGNLGDSTASFPVLFSIGSTYVDTQDVVELGPGDSATVQFAPWTALVRGATTAVCSTALAVDESTANDRISRNVNVRVRDVGVDQIVAPKGVINRGLPVAPQAWVTNHGTGGANFRATFRISDFYRESVNVSNLAAGASRLVSFISWGADTTGRFAVSCTLTMNGDLVPGNNLAQDSCFVEAVSNDAGVMRIVAPRGVLDSGVVLAPQAMVRNYGSNAITFPVIYTIGSAYADTQQVTSLDPLDSLLVTFDDWTASPVGTLVTRCSTAMAGDPLPGNDVRSDSVVVIIRHTDAGVARVVVPADTADSGTVFTPEAVVRNYGLTTVSFPVRMRVGGSYADTQQVTDLAAGDSAAVRFSDYTVSRRGNVAVVCSTALSGDQDPTNDAARKTMFRRVRNVGADSIVAPVGLVDSGTVVIPEATIRNYGNTTDSFPVIFRIGDFYADTQRTGAASVTFRPCTLNLVGTFTVQCSTAMEGDAFPENDARYDSVQVTSGVGISGSEPAPGVPRTVTLSRLGSSPFTGRVAIRYGLPRSADVRLQVYDACGRPVRVIVAGVGSPGYHTVVWQGADENGQDAPHGAYFVQLTADGVTLTDKLVKLE